MPDPSSAPATMARVLIVDDDPILREMLHYLLADKGFSILEAPDGNSAWAFVQREEIDAIVCDINMPGLSGLELCRRIYLERGLRIPTIIITCGSFDLFSSELSEFPIFLMHKPFGVSEVSAFLRRLLFRAGASIERDGLLFPSIGPARAGVAQSADDAGTRSAGDAGSRSVSDTDSVDEPVGHSDDEGPSPTGRNSVREADAAADATSGTADGPPASDSEVELARMFQTTTWSSDAACPEAPRRETWQ